MSDTRENDLLREADERARRYVRDVGSRRVFPSQDSIAALSRFDETLPPQGGSAEETLALLDDVGGAATVTSNGPHYYGFVIGATHPAAAAGDYDRKDCEPWAAGLDRHVARDDHPLPDRRRPSHGP